jgi:hypothetical protein
VPVSIVCLGAGEMALVSPLGTVWLAVRVDVQRDPRDLAPVGTFRIRMSMRM